VPVLLLPIGQLVHQGRVMRGIEVITIGGTKFRNPIFIPLVDSVEIHGIQSPYARVGHFVRVRSREPLTEDVGLRQVGEVRRRFHTSCTRNVLLDPLIGRYHREIKVIGRVQLVSQPLPIIY
jgi:hypothetical protein